MPQPLPGVVKAKGANDAPGWSGTTTTNGARPSGPQRSRATIPAMDCSIRTGTAKPLRPGGPRAGRSPGRARTLDCGGRAPVLRSSTVEGGQRRHRFRLRPHFPKRRGASLPAAVQKILVAAVPRCALYVSELPRNGLNLTKSTGTLGGGLPQMKLPEKSNGSRQSELCGLSRRQRWLVSHASVKTFNPLGRGCGSAGVNISRRSRRTWSA
jgi:hypothetical protein